MIIYQCDRCGNQSETNTLQSIKLREKLDPVNYKDINFSLCGDCCEMLVSMAKPISKEKGKRK